MPEEMTKSIQVPIPKVGNPKSVDDFRRISLCNAVYKPYAKWLRNRLKQFTGEPELHQAAYTEGRSTDDHVFIAKRVMDEYWNAGKTLFVASVDIKKAFDNVDLNKLKDILMDLEVPTHVIDRVLLCVKEDRAMIRWQGQYSESVKRGKGIKQGCPLSPFLFNLVIQYILKRVAEKVSNLKLLEVGVFTLPIILAFADDILILTEDQDELEKIIAALEDCLCEVGLEINSKKSQVLIRIPNATKPPPEKIMLNGKEYKTCKSLKYLGVTLTSDLNRPATTRQRSINAIKSAKNIVQFCKTFKPSWDIGKLIYKTVIAPAIQYGTKVSTLTKRSRLQLAKYEKLILKDIWNNCRVVKRKFNVRKEMSGKTINRRVRVARLNYYGHIIRRPNKHPLKSAFKFKFCFKKEGRPSFTWKDTLQQDFSRYRDMTNSKWKELATDREKLKKKAEEIYKDSNSEISDGEDSE